MEGEINYKMTLNSPWNVFVVVRTSLWVLLMRSDEHPITANVAYYCILGNVVLI